MHVYLVIIIISSLLKSHVCVCHPRYHGSPLKLAVVFVVKSESALF